LPCLLPGVRPNSSGLSTYLNPDFGCVASRLRKRSALFLTCTVALGTIRSIAAMVHAILNLFFGRLPRVCK